MRVGDIVRLREAVAVGTCRELLGEVGRVGEVVDREDGPRCTVVYEALKAALWDWRPEDFEAVPTPALELH